MTKSVFQSQFEDTEALDGLLETPPPQAESLGLAESVGTRLDMEEAVERVRSGRTNLNDPEPAEAIVMLYGYPSLLVQKGTFVEPENQTWRRRLEPDRARINHVLANSGRVDVEGHRSKKWLGTAWRVDETTFITNRHVATDFAEAIAGGHRIRRRMKVRIDLAEEHESDEQLEYLIGSILHIEDISIPGNVDMAVLKMHASAADIAGDPIELALNGKVPEFIGIAGYPARDWRNPEDPMNRIFGGIFDVKRFAPGRVMEADYSPTKFTHNCTTLGGNSGSVVCDINTGAAFGLHYAGSAREQNFAVKATAIADVLRKRSVSFQALDPVPAPDGDGPAEENGGRRNQQVDRDFEDRDGYDAAFLGTDALFLPTPQLNLIQEPMLASPSTGEALLKYRHFSIAMNKERRLAFFCAANIDGKELRRPRRKKSFRLDPRLPDNRQAGEDLYSDNDLDRGHLIRRLDPTWGTRDEAEQANVDSMFFTNIAPQHKDLNQKIWLGLEDHILNRTSDANARISIFVGCVFDERDPKDGPSGIKVPMGFWKVVASVGQVRKGRSIQHVLQTQAFLMRQDHLVQDSDLELFFGEKFKTHQITVEALERMTGLDFHVMRDADTFALPEKTRHMRITEAAGTEAPFAATRGAVKPLDSFDDIVFGPA